MISESLLRHPKLRWEGGKNFVTIDVPKKCNFPLILLVQMKILNTTSTNNRCLQYNCSPTCVNNHQSTTTTLNPAQANSVLVLATSEQRPHVDSGQWSKLTENLSTTNFFVHFVPFLKKN